MDDRTHHGFGPGAGGLGSRVGGSHSPRSYVAATYPLGTFGRSVPYLAVQNSTADDSFSSPRWNVKLTPLDSAGVSDICNDAAHDTLGLNSLSLENSRRYVLLP